ncbi:MAG: hypothetical protein AAF439_03730, partial [Pseudomonadota bacterium]
LLQACHGRQAGTLEEGCDHLSLPNLGDKFIILPPRSAIKAGFGPRINCLVMARLFRSAVAAA